MTDPDGAVFSAAQVQELSQLLATLSRLAATAGDQALRRRAETMQAQLIPDQATPGVPPGGDPEPRRCHAVTKHGQRCAIDARPSGLCHVHDPAVQCGAPTRRGRCAIATGGGRCEHHRGVADPVPPGTPGLF